MFICDNITVGPNGRLFFAGQDTVALAEQYGTPLYLMDEDRIRENCRLYQTAFRKHFGDGSRPLYASKAACFKRIYEIMSEEGMGIDVVSSGEIYTARLAGYDLSHAYFHSSNKTDEDIVYGMDSGVGYFVADNAEEIQLISTMARALNVDFSICRADMTDFRGKVMGSLVLNVSERDAGRVLDYLHATDYIIREDG